MTFDFNKRTKQIREAVGTRCLCWFGVRGIDALPLGNYGRLSHVYSQTAPIYDGFDIYEKSLESILMRRVDLNTYDIDFDLEHYTLDFKRTVLFGVKEKMILVPYRPQEFLSSIYFPHQESIHYFGLFHKFQRTFEHKPWVEKSLKDSGLCVIPWEYVRNIERDMVKEKISKGKALLIRPPYSSGGAGYSIIRELEDIFTNPVSASDDGFFSIAPYFQDSIPFNINGCIYKDGSVRIFLPSYQLIGIKELTTRPLGYCGNDFGTVKQMDKKIIDGIEEIAIKVGSWLARKEYLGIFGADLLVEQGQVYLVEINPRFQGSTLLSSQLSAEAGDGDPYGEHLAAFLGLEAPKLSPLWDRVTHMGNDSQVVAYNTSPREISLNIHAIEELSTDFNGIPNKYVHVAAEGMIFKKFFNHSVTNNGYTLFPEVSSALKKELSTLIK